MVPNFTIDREVSSAWGKLKLHAIVYHHGNSATSRHYTAGIKLNETWFYVDDKDVSKNKVRFSCKSNDSNGFCPYLLIYQKDSNMVPSFTHTISDENIPCTSTTTTEPISVHFKRKRNEHIDVDSMLLGSCSKKSVNTTPVTDVTCANCKKRITLPESKLKTITYTYCNATTRVS